MPQIFGDSRADVLTLALASYSHGKDSILCLIGTQSGARWVGNPMLILGQLYFGTCQWCASNNRDEDGVTLDDIYTVAECEKPFKSY